MGTVRNRSGNRPGRKSFCLRPCLILLCLLGAGPGMGADRGPQDRFVMAYSNRIFYDTDPKDAAAAVMVYSKEIGKERGFQVESHFYNNPDALANALLVGKADYAFFMADEYARLDKKLDFEAGVTLVRGGKKTQRFILLVSSGSPYHNLQDLRNGKLSLAQSDTLGLLYLDALLLKQKLPEAAKHFTFVNETLKPSQAILAVFFGQSDLCVVNERSYDIVAEMNPQVKERLRPIMTSPEYMLGVGIFQKDMSAEKRKSLVNLLLTLSDTPRGKQVLTLFRTERFTLVQSGELESVRQLIRENDALKVKR